MKKMSHDKPYKPDVKISTKLSRDKCALYQDYRHMLYKMSKDESLSFSQKHIADYMLHSMIHHYDRKCVKESDRYDP